MFIKNNLFWKIFLIKTIVALNFFHFQGYLLANHLHKEDLTDLSLYLHYYYLLTLCTEEQLGQLVMWREVYPTRCCHQQGEPPVLGYTEPEARWFLMVIGMVSAFCVFVDLDSTVLRMWIFHK
jgi:hypothetical protein